MPIGSRCLVAAAIAAAVSLSVSVMATGPADATVVRALDLSQKAHVARAIVLGRVEKQEARWIIENGAIKTIVTMRVEKALKGDVAVGKTIQVVMPGGQIGDFVHKVSGTSTFERGERAVMFLEPHPDGWVEIGIGIGKYGIQSVNGKPVVTHDPLVTVATVSGDEPMKLEPPKAMKPMLLAAFLTEVRTALRTEAK